MISTRLKPLWMFLIAGVMAMTSIQASHSQNLKVNELDYFEAPGVNVMVFSNTPGGMFFDAKTSGVEIIHHGVRTATNGDVRMLHTPEQWDGMGVLVDRTINKEENWIEAKLEYPEHNFSYRVRGVADGNGITITVHLDEELPEKLVGHAGFNMEFLPASYFGRTWMMDGKSGLFPRHPSGLMNVREDGLTEPKPITRGSTFVLAPEDPERRVVIREATGDNELMLFDGRNKAQNGWFVVRSMIPAGKSGQVIEWHLDINAIPDWVRDPVITHSQVGYHPEQKKQAIIELDKNDTPESRARLIRINPDGSTSEAHAGGLEEWGQYLRYNYVIFDFTEITEPGIYQIQYGDHKTKAFRIDPGVYDNTWHLTLDVFFPVQMDHIRVREAYRVWHGASHLDDAIQAPPHYEHFDLYRHEETDTDFETFEHIPGLNIGGWYDAGDYDIRTQSQYATVQRLVHAWEDFGIERDNTTVSQEKMYVEIHRPDGYNDIIQQIEHGTLALIAQHRAVGHAIPGIVAGHLYQYTHLGDGATKTNNMIYDPSMDPFADERHPGDMYLPSTDAPAPERRVMENDGIRSGEFDSRWAFTTNTSALNYGSAAALAAASRALRGYNDELAQECLETALNVWEYEQGREPNLFRHGNTTGGRYENEKLKTAVELLITTGEQRFADKVRELIPDVEDHFGSNVPMLMAAMPHMDDAYAEKMKELTRQYREDYRNFEEDNPFGVPITRGGWAGSGTVMGFGINNYLLHKAFPDIIEEELVYRALNFLFGTHPGSNYSFVSAVGANSQLVAYGMNRADFSFIPGGIVPGVLVLPPDFPENKDDWPFFWGQNEYVIPMGSSYIYLVNAAIDLLNNR